MQPRDDIDHYVAEYVGRDEADRTAYVKGNRLRLDTWGARLSGGVGTNAHRTADHVEVDAYEDGTLCIVLSVDGGTQWVMLRPVMAVKEEEVTR
jgi:hypothetical protein